jgi:predicted nucleotidyltransferase
MGKSKQYEQALPTGVNHRARFLSIFESMKSKAEIVGILKQHKESLLQKYPIASIAIFGSYARNAQNNQRDVDIIVEFNGRVGTAYIDLANEIERLLGVKTDVVSRKAIKPKYFAAIQSDLTVV